MKQKIPKSKNSKKTRKTKEIKLPMKFNPGRQIYEPELPVSEKGKKPKFKDVWMLILLFLIITSLFILTWWIDKIIFG